MPPKNIRLLLSIVTSIALVALPLCPVSLAAADLNQLIPQGQEPASETTPTPHPPLSSIETNVLQLLLDGKTTEAEKLVTKAIKQKKKTSQLSNLCYLRAALERIDGDNSHAAQDLERVLADLAPAKSIEDHLHRALLLKRIGDCYYGDRDLKPAITNYKAALEQCSVLPANSRLTATLLESIMGALILQKQYAEAESYGKRLLDITTVRATSGRFDDLGSLFWAEIQLLVLYRTTGQDAKRQEMRDMLAKLLDQLLAIRNELDTANKLPQAEDIQKIFQAEYISQYKPRTAAEYLWLSNEFKLRTLPLICWRPVSGQSPAKGAILCIHGLGMDNRSFSWFGHAMAAHNYVVYAMDVRGFGSWLATPGKEDVSFDEALTDIGGVINLIKEREPNLPVFVLGESMGGAIALRAGARYGKNLNGVISSVPSAERFQARRMSLIVAVHFLQDPNRPFRVGEMMTEKATANEALRQRMESDVKGKMDMTPKELIKFAVFMRTTKKECVSLDKTPVFFVQGLKDKLVKPQGTYDLFDAVSGDDKDMFVIGTAEHLIFETDKQSRLLLDTLNNWLSEHSQFSSEANAAN